MAQRNVIKCAITILYSKNANKILVGEKKVNTLYLSNSLGFPGALLQPGIDESFDYRKTNLDRISINNTYKSDAYGRSIAAARGLFIESGILPTVEGVPQKSRIETIENNPLLKAYREKVENYPSIFKDLFVAKCLDIKSFIPFTRLQLNTKSDISYDVEVFALPINDLSIGDKISNNVGKFHWVSADTIPGLKEVFATNHSNNFNLPSIEKGSVSKDVFETNKNDSHFQEVISRVNIAFLNGNNSMKSVHY
uniref:CRISPR-associated protein n=1 Tax=Strongyloides papillosus TaxID=174720 RepID=A0A0N5B916_STREA